jgi:hypothetical protein
MALEFDVQISLKDLVLPQRIERDITHAPGPERVVHLLSISVA